MRPTARDYKTMRGGGIDPGRYRQFGYGLACGLAVALLVFIVMNQRALQAREDAPGPRPEPRLAAGPGEAPPAEGANAGEQYDFYEMLPKFEVVVPEKDRDVKPDVPASAVERPGVYVLQAGSYRSQPDAERVRSQLALQGIRAVVQRVAVDADVWHRVRVGPISDLAELNRIRDKLRAADIDALVIRVGD
ncbi:MAG: Cell division protein FtsN [Steroidobacteraceae bacterium]|nr:Cell division protein FtsN [Steroidobacteraceae bacterium]